MEPLVAGPPMVHALEELVAASKSGPSDPFRYDPASARAAFWKGECGMALTWPTAAKGENRELRVEGREGKANQQGLVASATSSSKSEKSEKEASQIRVGFLELPGSRRVFNLTSHAWDDRTEDDNPRVPLISIAGRLGVVNVKSDQTDAAFQLLVWLSDNQMCTQISALSPATTLFRRAQLKSPGAWTEKPVAASAAVKYGEVTETALRHEQWLGALRLPGRAEYLAALDEAVAAAVHGEKSAIDALLEADAKWQKITERLGVDRQRAAYRHSLGLE
jgi:ABC-type glycerol-3-phosphate transport system substrate-binding protein